MPRNHSEALPSCPLAHVYADMAEQMMRDDAGKEMRFERIQLYHAIPSNQRDAITTARRAALGTWPSLYASLRFNIDYIREHYGA